MLCFKHSLFLLCSSNCFFPLNNNASFSIHVHVKSDPQHVGIYGYSNIMHEKYWFKLLKSKADLQLCKTKKYNVFKVASISQRNFNTIMVWLFHIQWKTFEK